ncbi:MAG: hypothetical protein IRZ29_05065 [Thermoflavifilum sp.]|nr:hypothetical protein [Thermoflavifilum sp.]
MDLQHLEEWMIRAVDNELSEQQWQELHDWLRAHPEWLAEWEKWKMTKLPKESFVYPDKQQLYRHRLVWVKRLGQIAAAAACLTGLWCLSKIFMPQLKYPEKPPIGLSQPAEQQAKPTLHRAVQQPDPAAESKESVAATWPAHPAVSASAHPVTSTNMDGSEGKTIVHPAREWTRPVDSTVFVLPPLSALHPWHHQPATDLTVQYPHPSIRLNQPADAEAAAKPVLSLSDHGSGTLGRMILAVAHTVNDLHKIHESLFETRHIHIELQKEND